MNLAQIYSFYEQTGTTVYNFYIQNSRLILDYIHGFFNGTFNILLYFTILLTFTYLLISLYLILNKRKIRERPIKNSQLPFVTVQIPTYNELAALNCAKKCLEFDYPKDKYEIIIGNDSSEKEVSRKINEFAKWNGIKVTSRGNNIGFKPGNLNHMLKFTKGDYIVVFDSDFLPKKDFLRRIIAPFVHNNKIDAVQARWRIKNFSQNIVSVVGGLIPMFSHMLALPFLMRTGGNGFIAGSAEAVRKKTLINMGGWRRGALTEDIEYSLRLTKAEKKITYLESLECDCETPFTLRDLGKQQMRWAYGVIKALKLHFGGILWKAPKHSLNVIMLLSGYLITILFFSLGVTGFLSILTHRPEAVQWIKFFSETTMNILLTSGFLLTGIITLVMSKKAREIPRMIIASFSVGLIVILYVTKGVLKALFNRPMQWFILAKHGNQNG